MSYCAKCSKEEYLNEAEDSTRKALQDLLNMISNDDTLPPKIKRKRLKMVCKLRVLKPRIDKRLDLI